MAGQRVYIRGCGVVSAVGSRQQAMADACRRGQAKPSATMLLHSCDHPLPFYAISGETDVISSLHLYRHIDRAVDSALHDAALTPQEIAQLPLFVGSTACDISALEVHYQQALHHNIHAVPLYRSGFGVLAGYVIDRLKSSGQEFTFNTACSSSANALLMATRMIEHGRIDTALVLGVETRNQMSLQGFSAMMLLSPHGSRPFDNSRNGTVLGEGVGAIILSRHPPTASEYAAYPPYYCVGGANLTDSINVTSSSAAMVAAVIQQTLDAANLAPRHIDVIKAHGTSTPANDSAEAQGIRQLFGGSPPPVTSLKPYIGHTLGACGVMEAILLLACVKENFIPATPGFTTLDATCGIRPLTQAIPLVGGNILLNYFGFGGNNTSLIFSNHP